MDRAAALTLARNMDKTRGIIVFGTNGSGKTTLARELARILNYKHIDIEEYAFEKSEIPYTAPRPREDCIRLMLADIERERSFVFSTAIGDWGSTIPLFYELAVYLSAPHELRMKRIKQRSYARYGERVLEGGDMYEQNNKFMDFAASRPLEKIERWAETLVCPVIQVDGTKDWRVNAEDVAGKYCLLVNRRSGLTE